MQDRPPVLSEIIIDSEAQIHYEARLQCEFISETLAMTGGYHKAVGRVATLLSLAQ